MFNSKYIYNSLNIRKLNFNFINKSFFIFKDSFKFSINLNISIKNTTTILFSRTTLKNLIFSNITQIKKIKFPLLILFSSYYNLFESSFLNIFFYKTIFLILKSQKKIYMFKQKSFLYNFKSSRLSRILNLFLMKFYVVNNLYFFSNSTNLRM
jgi:hypothetical protein